MEFHEKELLEFLIIIVANHKGNPRYMKLNELLLKRISEICDEKGIVSCHAALGGGKSPSAIYDLAKSVADSVVKAAATILSPAIRTGTNVAAALLGSDAAFSF